MIKKSLTLRILALNFLLLALPLLIYSFIFFQNSYFDSIEQAKLELREVANFRAFSLSEIQPLKPILLTGINYFLNLTPLLETGKLNAKDISQKMSIAFPPDQSLRIYLLQNTGRGRYKVLASNIMLLVDTYFTSYIKLGDIEKRGEGNLIRLIYSRDTGEYFPTIFLARALYNAKQEPIGILMSSADIKQEFASILTKGGASSDINFAILSSDGIVFDSTMSSLRGHYIGPLAPDRRAEILRSGQLGNLNLAPDPLPIIQGEDPPFFEFVFNDQVQIAYRAFVPGLNVSVLAFSSKQEYFAAAISHFLLIYVIYGFILILGGGIAYWLSLWFSHPLRQLNQVMGEVSQGHLEKRFHEEPLGFEINLLGGIFNATLNALFENVQKAQDEKVQKEIYQREIDIGREAQKSLLPRTIPEIEGAEVAATYLPAQEVGADFYFYLSKKNRQNEECFVFGVSDAAGKGISSCLYAVYFRSLFISYASLYDDLGEILSKTNNDFLEVAGESGMFVKALQGIYNTKSRILTYFSCGNVPGIVRRKEGQLIPLEQAGMAIGLMPSEEYKLNSIQLESGDLVLFFTDGLLFATNEKHQHFSIERLRAILQQRKWNSAQEAIDGLKEELSRFTSSLVQEDEITMIAFYVR